MERDPLKTLTHFVRTGVCSIVLSLSAFFVMAGAHTPPNWGRAVASAGVLALLAIACVRLKSETFMEQNLNAELLLTKKKLEKEIGDAANARAQELREKAKQERPFGEWDDEALAQALRDPARVNAALLGEVLARISLPDGAPLKSKPFYVGVCSRTPEEIRQALTDLETIWKLADTPDERQIWECRGVAAALRWALGESGGRLDQNLKDNQGDAGSRAEKLKP